MIFSPPILLQLHAKTKTYYLVSYVRLYIVTLINK